MAHLLVVVGEVTALEFAGLVYFVDGLLLCPLLSHLANRCHFARLAPLLVLVLLHFVFLVVVLLFLLHVLVVKVDAEDVLRFL